MNDALHCTVYTDCCLNLAIRVVGSRQLCLFFSYLLCFLAIPLILTDYARKFNETMTEMKCMCAVLKRNAYCSAAIMI